VVDGRHAFAETEGFEDALDFERHADARAHERYAEIGHCVGVWRCECECGGAFMWWADGRLVGGGIYRARVKEL
jgi:hypothetical protein